MRFILIVFSVLVLLFARINCSLIDSYPCYELLNDDGDPGEALYLTKYIESGDIETVCHGFV